MTRMLRRHGFLRIFKLLKDWVELLPLSFGEGWW